MNIADCLFYLLVEPLKLLFEVIYFYSYKYTGSAGLSIVVMSLAVNLLLLPLYFRADKIEKEQLAKKKMMEPWIRKIKSAFKGDERIMIMQAYYKENDYRSLDVFKESLSLFLQVPFFIAAYSFLSHLGILNGVSLGPVPDLGTPDGLIRVGDRAVNALPIAMTAINIFSGFIYTTKGQVKDKIKLVAIALVFLVLLYGSPSGLVFYWTLNNLFSLCKNIVVRFLKKPECSSKAPVINKHRGEFPLIILSCAVLAVVTGLMIPSDVISQNPEELINTYSMNPHSPLLYLLNSSMISIGTFLIWIPLFLYLTKESLVRFMTYAVPPLALAGTANYIFFNKNFGLLSSKLIYATDIIYFPKEKLINLLLDMAIIAVAVVLVCLLKKNMRFVVLIALIAVCIISGRNVSKILRLTADTVYTPYNTYDDINIRLSTTGQNVVVIMMDRMINSYIPYIFNERPDVAAQFDGFTYYPNTVSFAEHTNMALPALFGGYEYTPTAINSRDDELLVDKHNESLCVMPVLFANNGWNVYVGDPSYANYGWLPDTSIYDGYEGITAYNLSGVFNDKSDLLIDAAEEFEGRLNRNLFCFGFMKVLPYVLQGKAYSFGSYNSMEYYYSGTNDNYVGVSDHQQVGLYGGFIQNYLVLEHLSDVIEITDEQEDNFFMFCNNTTHQINLLQEPEYVPSLYVDNTEYDAAHTDRFVLNGRIMHMDNGQATYLHYECDMAACILLGRWFDYLRANNLYDNTRIIIVADHGHPLGQFDDMVFSDPAVDVQGVNPILMVKDFGSQGFTVSYEFMTNADTPSLAAAGVIDDPVNPFTGNPINMDDKYGDQLIYFSENFNVNDNNGTVFTDPDGYWLSVRDNIFEEQNWGIYPQ